MTGRIFIILLSLVVLTGGSIYLARHMIPAPQHRVEKVISNARFFK